MKIALRSMGTSTFLKNAKKIYTKNVLLYVYIELFYIWRFIKSVNGPDHPDVLIIQGSLERMIL